VREVFHKNVKRDGEWNVFNIFLPFGREKTLLQIFLSATAPLLYLFFILVRLDGIALMVKRVPAALCHQRIQGDIILTCTLV
ncbi:MAG: hypothetical protein R3Y06_04930, partial [Faecalibacterium sp.]